MDPLTVTLAVLGAAAGGAGGFGLHLMKTAGEGLELVADFILIFAGEHQAKERPPHKEPSLALHIATGALAGALTLGSVPAIVNHFTGAAESAAPHQVTMAECAKKAQPGVSKIEIETQPDGLKICHYTP